MRRVLTSLVAYAVTLTMFSAGCSRNKPPAAPQLGGSRYGSPGETLAYTFSATDPDNQELGYLVAWDDTSAVEWSAPYPSGQQVTGD